MLCKVGSYIKKHFFSLLNFNKMKQNKYSYFSVIQQNYGQGWEDVSHYETNSSFINTKKSGVMTTNSRGRIYEMSLISHDLREYRLTGFATRLINRKELNTNL